MKNLCLVYRGALARNGGYIATYIVAILLVNVLAFPAAAQTARNLPVVRVAIITDGATERALKLRSLFLEEMRVVNRGEFDILVPADLQLEGDRSLTSVRTVLDKMFEDPRTDMVVTLGVLASHAAALRESLPKPVIAPLVSKRVLQDLPYKDGASGKHNLSYVSHDVDIRRDIIAFRGIVPFARLAFLLDAEIMKTIPCVHDEVTRVALELGIEVKMVTVADAAEPAFCYSEGCTGGVCRTTSRLVA